MTVLVTGSRGRVGSTLIALLHGAGADVRAASAAPEKLRPLAGVDTVHCALDDPATFPAALDSVTSVFLYAEPSQTGAFLDEARAAGVEHIVLLSSSSALDPDAADNPIAASHLAVEQAVAASPIETSVLQPGAFAGNAFQWRWALESAGAIDLPYPGSYSDPIHERDIAEAAFALLARPEPRGRTYHLTGPESLTFTEQLAILERAVGGPFPFNAVTREAWKASMAGYMPSAFADGLLDYWASTDGSPTPLTHAVEELTGHPARTFAQWATENADAFRTAWPARAAR
ncbi:NmrA family NAD(P)-binding protein [Streptomyces lunaelactis]|uniref:SDR family oxidoreductase n=1 Tax=Streptomyces lunaelactis TaxID=1535768 RepID=UPI001585310D|nr:NAD(P)H-binding protein [Streptomyces lunaelactis]NUK37036.1 NmrA family NAD(P)-binding protein [Streptomyces lunaelactis]NUK43049.1 NmrA family NAD(P)-binding protein [Streptomyces lunaelactis]